jgi:pyruvate dehydrogenase E1 component alpha subunit
MTQPSEASTAIHLELYRQMQLIRRTEEILIHEYHPADEMRCPIHFCVGQEATPAALSLLLKRGDTVFSHHRSHGYYLATGAPLEKMVAEFYGKKTGANGGLAGSQELSYDASGFYSGTILSGAFALTCGSAFAARYNGTDNISVGVVGDGGMEEGIVYEALNLAAVKSLPALFVCENNGYSVHTPMEERSLSSHLVDRARSFGLDAHLLDGNDAISLHTAFTGILSRIRAGNGPVFVEVETYRYCGHVGPEDDDRYNYRPSTEIAKWKGRDPIRLLSAALRDGGVSADQLMAIDVACDEAVYGAIAAAKTAEFPDFDEAVTFNLRGDYSTVVKEFVDDIVSDFDPAQQETALRPY